MLQALFLVALGTASRLTPPDWNLHAWNLVPMGALALFAGSRFPRRAAWMIPVAAMILSDLVLDQKYGGFFHSPSRWVSYGAFGLIAVLGVLAQGSKGTVLRLAGLSLSGSVVFFLASNFGVWAWPNGTNYPASLAGLLQCYAAGIPFFKNTVLADLLGTAVLFGSAPILSRAWNRWTTRAAQTELDLVSAGTR